MKRYKVIADSFCEGYLHERMNYPREGLTEKKLIKGDVVRLEKVWSNLYGEYHRVIKDNVHYDMLRRNLEEIS